MHSMLVIDFELNYKHFSKDVGMIPYMLEKHHGYRCTILGCNAIKGYHKPYQDYAVDYDICEKYYGPDILNVMRYLRQNAMKYDILNLYHFNAKRNLLLTMVYKKYNNDGIVYLKLDMGLRGCEMCKGDPFTKRLFKKYSLKLINIISDENRIVCKELSNLYGVNICYIPNGCYSEVMTERITETRNNDFLYVGRIKKAPKNVDFLLRAFSDAGHNLNLTLVGKIEESFKDELCGIIESNGLRERVTIYGEVRDKQLLNEIYDNSKVLIVPSRWESFGLVMVEGISHGCYIIASDAVSSAADIIKNEKIGLVFKNEDAKDLTDCINKAANMEVNRKIIYRASDSFRWRDICDNLSDMIEKCFDLKNH